MRPRKWDDLIGPHYHTSYLGCQSGTSDGWAGESYCIRGAHSYRFGCFFVVSPQTILIPKVLFMVPNVAISIHIIKYRFINVMIIRPTFTPKHSQGLILVRPRKGASKTIALSRSQKAYWKMSESNQKFQVVFFFEPRKVQKKKVLQNHVSAVNNQLAESPVKPWIQNQASLCVCAWRCIPIRYTSI